MKNIPFLIGILLILYSPCFSQNVIPHRGIIQSVYNNDTVEFRMTEDTLNIKSNHKNINFEGTANIDSIVIKTDSEHTITIGTHSGLLLHDKSTLWIDKSISTLSLTHGPSIPDIEEMGSTGIFMPSFDGINIEEKVFGTIKVPYEAKANDSVYIYVHSAPSTADAGNYTWNFAYILTIDDTMLNVSDTLRITLQAGGLLISKTAFFKGIYIERPGTRIVFCFYRKPTDPSDTYEHNVFTGLLGIKYKMIRLGTEDYME